MIYFIYDHVSDCIKIGYTAKDPKSRLDSLQTGNPNKLIMLGWCEGESEEEIGLHERLCEYKCEGGSEWFMVSGDVLKVVKDKLSNERYNVFYNIYLDFMKDDDQYITERRAADIMGSFNPSRYISGSNPFGLSLERLPRYFLSGSGMGGNGQYFFKKSDIYRFMNTYIGQVKSGQMLTEIPYSEYVFLNDFYKKTQEEKKKTLTEHDSIKSIIQESIKEQFNVKENK